MTIPNDPGRLPPAHDSPDGVDLDRAWTGVATEVWRRHPGWTERTAARLLRSPGLARALVTTPSLLLPWLISTVAAFGAGALVSIGPGQPLVWLIAPGVAGVGAVSVTVGSASVGAGAGVAAWAITVLASQTASGRATAAATNVHVYLPYLAVAVYCAGIVGYATRPQREF